MAENNNQSVSKDLMLKCIGGILLIVLSGFLGSLWKDSMLHGREIQDLKSWQENIKAEMPTLRQLDKGYGQLHYQTLETHKLVRELLDALKIQQSELDKQNVQQIRFQILLEEIKSQTARRNK